MLTVKQVDMLRSRDRSLELVKKRRQIQSHCLVRQRKGKYKEEAANCQPSI